MFRIRSQNPFYGFNATPHWRLTGNALKMKEKCLAANFIFFRSFFRSYLVHAIIIENTDGIKREQSTFEIILLLLLNFVSYKLKRKHKMKMNGNEVLERRPHLLDATTMTEISTVVQRCSKMMKLENC